MSRFPFHRQAEDYESFIAWMDALEREARRGRALRVTGPSENTD